MGSKWIWVAASVAFGIVCGAVYAWLRRSDGHSLRRFVTWSAAYAATGLIICRLLWIVFYSSEG